MSVQMLDACELTFSNLILSVLQRLNESNLDDRAWSGCAVLFLGCSSPAHNLLSIYKDEQGKFSLFKVIKLTLTGMHQ